MDNAMNAVNSLFAKGGASEKTTSSSSADQTNSSTAPATKTTTTGTGNEEVDTEVDTKVAPAVEHTHVRKEHETREQTVVEKEKHQDHYHTTIQPLKDAEVVPEQHDYTQETKHRSIDRDDGGATAKAKAQADLAGVENTTEEKQFEATTRETARGEEHVHHHLHETVQPVIEKEVVVPSVTHKRIDVKEKIQEPSQHHGVTTNSAVSVEEFQRKLDEEKKQ